MFGCNFLLVDGARIGSLIGSIKQVYSSQGKSLYLGKSKDELEDVGPFLFQIKESDELDFWFNKDGWGNSFGIYVNARVSFNELFNHCRKFLIVRTDDKNELYFRFYDPRVLRIFLPTCNSIQLKEFFGPIDFFILEDEDINYAIKFHLDSEKLVTNRVLLSDLNILVNSEPDNQNLNTDSKYLSKLENHHTIDRSENNNMETKNKVKKWNDFFFE